MSDLSLHSSGALHNVLPTYAMDQIISTHTHSLSLSAAPSLAFLFLPRDSAGASLHTARHPRLPSERGHPLCTPRRIAGPRAAL